MKKTLADCIAWRKFFTALYACLSHPVKLLYALFRNFQSFLQDVYYGLRNNNFKILISWSNSLFSWTKYESLWKI